MTPTERLLHETIIRALQMVLNVWMKHLKACEEQDKEVKDSQH
jgi:hypothetical protein